MKMREGIRQIAFLLVITILGPTLLSVGMEYALPQKEVKASVPDNSAYTQMIVNKIAPEAFQPQGIRPVAGISETETVDVNTATGELRVSKTDLFLKGRGGMDFALTRHYNSSQAVTQEIGTISGESSQSFIIGTKTTRYLEYYTDMSSLDFNSAWTLAGDETAGNEHSNQVALGPYTTGNVIALKDDYNNGLFNYILGPSYEKVQFDDGEDVCYVYVLVKYSGFTQYGGSNSAIQVASVVEKPESNPYGNIGAGWEFDIPYIEIKGTGASACLYLNYGSAGTFPIKNSVYGPCLKYQMEDYEFTWIKTGNTLEGYCLYDIKQGITSIFYPDGSIHKQVDRFQNTITYVYNNSKLSYILDTAGRKISFVEETVSGVTYLRVEVKESESSGTISKTIQYTKETVQTPRGRNMPKLSKVSYVNADASELQNASGTVSQAEVSYGYATGSIGVSVFTRTPNGTATQIMDTVLLTQIGYATGAKKNMEYTNSQGSFYFRKNLGMDGYMSLYKVNHTYDEEAPEGTPPATNEVNDTYYSYGCGPDYQTNYLQREYDYYPLYVTLDPSDIEEADEVFLEQKEAQIGPSARTLVTYQSGDGTIGEIKEYNARLLLRYSEKGYKAFGQTVFTTNHREEMDYVRTKPLVTQKRTYAGNPKVSGQFTVTHEGFTYDDFGRLIRYYDENSPHAVNATTQKAMFTGGPREKYTYHEPDERSFLYKAGVTSCVKYSLLSSKETFPDNTQNVTIEAYDYNSDNPYEIEYKRVYTWMGTGALTEKEQTKYLYDSYGNVVWETAYLSVGSGQVFSEYREVEYSYAANNSLPAGFNGVYLTRKSVYNVTDADGNNISNISKNPSRVLGEKTEEFMYDVLGNLVQTIDGSDCKTVIEYDVLGRKTDEIKKRRTIINGNYDITDQSIHYDYTVNENENYVITSYGQASIAKRRIDYDSLGRLKYESYKNSITGLITRVKECRYDNQSRLSEEINGEGDSRTVYDYGVDNRLIEKRVKNASNVEKYREAYTYQFGAGGDKERIVKTVYGETGSGNQITTQYINPAGELYKQVRTGTTNEVSPQGVYTANAAMTQTELYQYNFAGNLIAYTDPVEATKNNPQNTTYEYDYAGRCIQSTNVLNEVSTTIYDALGRAVKQTDPKGTEITYVYNQLNDLVREEVPVETKNGGDAVQIQKHYYDGNGRIVKETVSDSAISAASVNYANRTEYTYNGTGQVLEQRQYSSLASVTPLSKVAYTYDYAGRKTAMTAGNATTRTTQYTYDDMWNLKEESLPSGATNTFTYNRNGQLIKHRQTDQSVILYTYDPLGNLLTQKSRLTENGADQDLQEYTYYKTGLRKTSSNNAVTTTNEYDSFGRLIKETDQYKNTNGVLNGQQAVKKYAYDENNNKVGFYLQSRYLSAFSSAIVEQQNLKYSYNGVNQLTDVYDYQESRTIQEILYDSNGNKIRETNYPDGTYRSAYFETTYTYNKGNMLLSVENKKSKLGSADVVISKMEYKYNLNGMQREKHEWSRDADINAPLADKGTTNFYYYADGALLSEIHSSGAVSEYGYDSWGNRVYVLDETMCVSTSYTYDVDNKLEQESYSNALNNTSWTVSYAYDGRGNLTRTIKGAEIITNTYNLYNQQISTGSNNFGCPVIYRYNPDGLRINISNDEFYEEYWHIWSGMQMVSQLNYNWDYGTYSAKKFVRGERLIYQGYANLNASYQKWMIYNGHSDVVQLGSYTGTLTGAIAYDAFGNETASIGMSETQFRYCGEFWDGTNGQFGYSGTYYLRMRSYQPRTGRFTTMDPARDGLNWYAYCDSDPVNFIDPMGLIAVLARYVVEKNGGQIWWNGDKNETTIKMYNYKLGWETYITYTGLDIINGRVVIDSGALAAWFGMQDDQLQHQDGDRFYSENDAATAWALKNNPESIVEEYGLKSTEAKRERGAAIYEDNGKFYFETAPRKNGRIGDVNIPIDRKRNCVATIHTHGATYMKMEDEEFSGKDIRGAWDSCRDKYLVTPGGLLVKYTFDGTNNLSERISIVTTKIPCAPNFPR